MIAQTEESAGVAPAEDPTPDEGTGEGRWAQFAISAALVALPFLVVDFPPSTDLAQHAAQVRLAAEVASGEASAYRVQPLTPYSLGYSLIALLYALAGPENAGRLALLLVALLWVCAAHLLAARFGRPAASATLASIFVFNISLYWGFFNFVAGWPLFAVWLLLMRRDAVWRRAWAYGAAVSVASVALYFVHALWLAVAVGWLAAASLLFRPRPRIIVVRAAAVLPAVALAAAWYWSFSATSYAATASLWHTGPLARVTSPWLVWTSLGGLRGSLEPAILSAIAVWAGAAVWQHRSVLRESVDLQLAVCGGLFFVLALVAPNRYQNTTLFAERWVCFAAILLLLALPAPRLGPALRRGAALALLAVFCLATAAAWRVFDAREMSGMKAALGALPPGQRLLGLDFVRTSEVIRGSPFMQCFAYGQVVKGATLNFTFAQFPHSFVTLAPEERSKRVWTQGLEWHPEWLEPADLEHFDYVVVNASPEQHDALVAGLRLAPATPEGRWRLYRSPGGAPSR